MGSDGGGSAATQHGAEAEDEFVGLERFVEVVVGARFEAGDAIFGGAAGGEKKDGDFSVGGAERVGEGETGFVGHHDIEHE